MADRVRDRPGAGLPPPPAVPARSPPASVVGEVEMRIDGPSGAPSLEARGRLPADAVRAVVLCHPHPLYGGSMHSPVPLALAKRLAEVQTPSLAWVRFNFRGVGASEGRYGEGAGELEDARAVVAHVRAALPRAPVTLAGHSFGSWIAFRAAALEPSVDRAVLIAPGSRIFDFGDPPADRPLSTTVFIGDRDEICDPDDARALGERLGAHVRVFEGFDHHFLKSRRALADAALPVIAPEVPTP